MLSTATNSWASEASNSQDDSEDQVRSETNVNNDIYRTLNNDSDTSENNNESRTNILSLNNRILFHVGYYHIFNAFDRLFSWQKIQNKM